MTARPVVARNVRFVDRAAKAVRQATERAAARQQELTDKRSREGRK